MAASTRILLFLCLVMVFSVCTVVSFPHDHTTGPRLLALPEPYVDAAREETGMALSLKKWIKDTKFPSTVIKY